VNSLESNLRVAENNVVEEHTCGKTVLQLLLYSMRENYDYFLDQNQYIRNFPNLGELEQDSRYFWIFSNLDYKWWSKLDENVKVLMLCGSPTLEDSVSQVVRTLQKNDATNLLLYFFFRSTRHAERPPKPLNAADWQNLVFVYTLLREVMDYYPPPQQQSLFKTFLTEILAHMDDTKLGKLPHNATEAFKMLLCLSTVQNLWDALEQVLRKAADLYEQTIVLEHPDATRNKRNLTFIFDLGIAPIETVRTWINHVRRTMANLGGDYLTVRLLITKPPSIGDLGLQQPSENLLEYDKERQGLCSPYAPAFPTAVTSHHLTSSQTV